MTPAVLFEHSHRKDVWRLEVATHEGRTFVNWRKWWWDDGTLKPSKIGVIIPLKRLAEMEAAIAEWRKANAPDWPISGS